jgi:hypothetical protein
MLTNAKTMRRTVMKKIYLLFCSVMILFFTQSLLYSQGMIRSTGIGFRAGVWKNDASDYHSSQTGGVSSEGAGSVYFFSRLKDRWFFETSIGGVGKSEVGSGRVESIAMTPFLFGARYDFLSPKYNSQYQPYVSFGAGTYWITKSTVGGGRVETGTDAKFGAFLGTGINIILKNWFALNSDIKYHIVDLEGTAVKNYSGLELSIGFSFMWGKKSEIFRVRETKLIVEDIYPAYYQFYNTYPLAYVRIENTAGYPIEINIISNVSPYSSTAKESGFIVIEKGEVKDIPVTAIFNADIFEVASREPAVLDIQIEGRAGTIHTHEISAQLTIHTRNSWNGEMDKLVFFVTPDEQEIVTMSREIANDIASEDSLKTANFVYAKAIFEEISQMNIQYQSDPNVPFYGDDRVQFAHETLAMKRGDCDDLVVLYASLLESLGINTAFVQVKDPEKPMAHLYLMFDTGLHESKASKISSNEKRYVVKENNSGEKTIWIPIETTLISKGFEESWKFGAINYLEESELRNGIEEGWVRIFEVD